MAETATESEGSRPALSSQPSLHDMSDIPTPHGLAKREVTKFTDTWNRICRDSLVGDGMVLQAAAICSHTGNVYAYSPDDFLPTIEQIKAIVAAMTNPSSLALAGIKVAGNTYAYSSCQVSGSTAHCFTGERADGDGGILIYITKHTIMMGAYCRDRDKAITWMEDIWNWVRDTGF